MSNITEVKEDLRIGVLRRDHPEENEILALAALFPDRNLVFVRLDSVDTDDHDRLCRELGLWDVILPKERPIPSKASERGVRHITMIDGVFYKLLPLKPEFEPYNPSS